MAKNDCFKQRIQNVSELRLVRQLTAWHCPHMLACTALHAALQPGGRRHLSISLARRPGAQQQTRRSGR